jgi:excisionase family DNA binding protein
MASTLSEIPMILTVQELSRRTAIPERTLQHHIDKGALTARRIGPRRLYIDLEEAERYVGRPLSRNTAAQSLDEMPDGFVI